MSIFSFKKKKGTLAEILNMSEARYNELGVEVHKLTRSSERLDTNQADVMIKLSEIATTPQELFLLGVFYGKLFSQELYSGEEGALIKEVIVN